MGMREGPVEGPVLTKTMSPGSERVSLPFSLELLLVSEVFTETGPGN